MLETDPNVERSMAISQGIEKILLPYCKLYKKASTVQIAIHGFVTKLFNLIINVSSVLSIS